MTVNDASETLAVAEPSIGVLDPKDPMVSARKLVARNFTTPAGLKTLWRHRGTFWSWTGNYYEFTNDETLRTCAWNFLERAMRRSGEGVMQFKPTRANVGEVVDAMTAVCQLDEHLDPPVWLSTNSMPPAGELFACANGLVHLPTKRLYPPTPDYFCLNASEVTYDPDAAEPEKWLAFLNQLFPTDVKAIELIQEWFGYSMSPDTSQEKILYLIGPMRSGKGTIARILTKLLGSTAVAGPTMRSLGDTFGMEPLITKSLAIISDVRIGRNTDKSTILERLLSISGEDGMTIARKFLSAWHGKLLLRVMLMTNELLALPDSSGAFASRLLILLLIESFYGKEDPMLTNKLTTELSGIMNWSIEGHRRLNERGHFVQPTSGNNTIEAIGVLGSPVKAFVSDCCLVGPGLSATLDELFAAWETWCAKERRRDPGTKEWFARNLNAAVPGLTVTRPTNEAGQQVKTYQGITVPM